ncbi:MAG: pitrilysin family protein [Ignavibacteriales bacterium]|nr:pitrilysin family protein [Ignavibacteriales bacterium]
MKDILKIEYEKYKLANGLEVILFQDKNLPLIAVNLWYHVGSANEPNGKTGFAHLFEHMMFQGSQNIPKQMHFQYIQEAGGNLNGSTSLDRTNYYETVPSNFLELALWLESDRMGFLLPSLDQEKLTNQIDVVKNERLQRYDNAPYGLAWEILFSNLYPNDHPYHAPTIGWMKDILSMKLVDVENFFRNYYSPNNSTLVVGGEFDIDEAKRLIELYFGSIPKGNELPDIKMPIANLGKNISIMHEDNVQLPRLYLAWHSAIAFSKDDTGLEILADVLGGSKNARIHKSLVFEKEIAQQISVYQYSAKLSGSFIIVATAKPGISLDKLKEEIFIEINKLIAEGITDSELTRSKNGIKSSFIYSMQNLENLVDRINEYNFFLNEPDSFRQDLDRYNQVTREEIKNVAKEYLLKPYVELKVVPKISSESEGI